MSPTSEVRPRGRHEQKSAVMAVANTLLKQAFAIAKSGRPYEENYRSKLA